MCFQRLESNWATYRLMWPWWQSVGSCSWNQVSFAFIIRRWKTLSTLLVRSKNTHIIFLHKPGWCNQIFLSFVNVARSLCFWSKITIDTINCNLPHYNNIFIHQVQIKHTTTLPTLSREFKDENWPEKSLEGVGLELPTLRSTFVHKRLLCLSLFWHSQCPGKVAAW